MAFRLFVEESYLPSIFLFNIPQKLSKMTESTPFTHRTETSAFSRPGRLTRMINPNIAISVSNGASASSNPSGAASCCCLFLLACRDQAFSIVNPSPHDRWLSHSQGIRNDLISVSITSIKESTDLHGRLKWNSDGKGRYFLGMLDMLLATPCTCDDLLAWQLQSVCRPVSTTYHCRPYILP